MFPAIEQLIPHRAPMRWVDELLDCTDTTATATTRFTADHFAVVQPSERRLQAAALSCCYHWMLPPEGGVPFQRCRTWRARSAV